MTDLLIGSFNDLLNDLISNLNLYLEKLTDYIMRIETLPEATGILSEETMNTAYLYVYAAAITFIALKFLWKGFEVYILWRDGDAETNPSEMITGMSIGVVTMIAFPLLYDYLADATLDLCNGILSSFGGSNYVSSFADIQKMQSNGGIIVIFLLIYLIVFVIFYIKLLARGWEMFVLRLGIPVACVGLIDSDKGIFKGYVQILFKAVFTTIIQMLLMSLSLRFLLVLNFAGLLAAASLLMQAFSIPALLQQILAGQGRGGVGQKISSGAMLASNIKRLFGK